MERYSRRYVGDVLELTIDEITSKSVEDLIDQGRRFTIVKDSEDGPEDVDYG